jgi:2-oxoglutarate ferredoxin oxidoreductase subunit beta
MLMAIAAGAGFVARAYSGNKEHLISVMKQAIQYNGYAIVDVLQPCVSFNKVNNYAYYSQRVYELDNSYQSFDKVTALQKAMEFGDRIPIGVLYQESKLSYHQKNTILKSGIPLIDRSDDLAIVRKFMEEFI